MSQGRHLDNPGGARDLRSYGMRPGSGSGPPPPPSSSSMRSFNHKSSSLHRCAIALCPNPALAEGVCAMHLSRTAGHPSEASSRRLAHSDLIEPSTSGIYEPAATNFHESQRFYRSSPQGAMQSRSMQSSKKQRTSVDSDRYKDLMASNGEGQNGSSMPLTRENINEMVERMKYAKNSAFGANSHFMGNGGSMSTFSDHATKFSQRPSVSTPSVQSESEMSMDADRETNLRRERNRIAARKSRQRKLDRISNLEEEKQRLEQHRDMLMQEIRNLEKKDTGRSSMSSMTIPDNEYAQLQERRVSIIAEVEEAFNSGNILSTVKYMRGDSIVSGPQNSSVHLRGKDALVLDYLCTTYLFGDIHLQHTKVDNGGPRSQHFRVHWIFSGMVNEAGVSMNNEFLELIQSVRGKRVTIEGVSNFSFSGDKIVYVHRTADQAKFLSTMVKLSKK